jgi:hypothetical protein
MARLNRTLVRLNATASTGAHLDRPRCIATRTEIEDPTTKIIESGNIDINENPWKQITLASCARLPKVLNKILQPLRLGLVESDDSDVGLWHSKLIQYINQPCDQINFSLVVIAPIDISHLLKPR